MGYSLAGGEAADQVRGHHWAIVSEEKATVGGQWGHQHQLEKFAKRQLPGVYLGQNSQGSGWVFMIPLLTFVFIIYK